MHATYNKLFVKHVGLVTTARASSDKRNRKASGSQRSLRVKEPKQQLRRRLASGQKLREKIINLKTNYYVSLYQVG